MISFDDVETLITKSASPGIRPGLVRIERLLAILDNPQGKYPAIHVVGTNGKGSTCAFLASTFQSAGCKTALYTSPHLESPGERLAIDGHFLSPERWMACAAKIADVIACDKMLNDDPPSYFELVTATAFLLIAEEKVDIAIIEAGLGGRLDATNLLLNVICTAITSISMDHTEYLGDTIEAIAQEKFAVIRPGVPACYLGDNEALIAIFERFYNNINAYNLEKSGKSFVVLRDAKLDGIKFAENGCEFDFLIKNKDKNFELKNLRTGLLGRYQIFNAALALSVLFQIKFYIKNNSNNLNKLNNLTEKNIRAGILNALWPGRLEIINQIITPSENNSNKFIIVLDGGHNLDGVTKLVESVTELWGNKKIGIVYAAMKDKDYKACIVIMSQLNAAFYATSVPDMERALPSDAMANAAIEAMTEINKIKKENKFIWRNKIVNSFKNPLDAITEASKDNDVVLVCGSLYLIGWVRSRLVKHD